MAGTIELAWDRQDGSYIGRIEGDRIETPDGLWLGRDLVVSGVYFTTVERDEPAHPETAKRTYRPPIGNQPVYGVREIAEVLGVKADTVAHWHRRQVKGFPRADAQLSTGPVWLVTSIEPWLAGMAEWAPCIYCGAILPNEPVPDTDDEDAWAWLAGRHKRGCEWVRTRAHAQ